MMQDSEPPRAEPPRAEALHARPPGAEPSSEVRGKFAGKTARMTLGSRAAIAAVIAIMLASAWRAAGGPDQLFLVISLAAVVLIAVEIRNIPANLRNTALILFGASLVLLPFARDPLEAVQRGVFVSGLLMAVMASIMLLARCALRSSQVQLIGTTLRGLPRGRRYLSFTLASQLFGATLGMAGANIMLVMAAPSTDIPVAERVSTIVAVTRGFSAAIFWSPMVGNMAILLALYPQLLWREVFPTGMVAALITVVVGATLTHFTGRPAQGIRGQEPAPVKADEKSSDETSTNEKSSALPGKSFAGAAVPVLAAMLGFLATVLATSSFFDLRITAAIVILSPVMALLVNILMAGPGRRVVQGWRHLSDDTRLFPKLASEALLFAAAGCAGSIMASAFPASWVQRISEVLTGLPFLAIVFLMFSIMAMSLAGIHPVLTAVFMASAITPQVLGLPPEVHFAAILYGWGLSGSLSPYSAMSLTAARYSGTGLYSISIERNWLFALVSSLLICTGLTMLTTAIR